MFSGAAIPTERAFVMNGIVFAAILIDRLRLSMRICAFAAFVVLLLDPASLVGVSFQMSFGAVVALIAVYETWGTRLAYLFHSGSFARKVLGSVSFALPPAGGEVTSNPGNWIDGWPNNC